MNNDQREKVVPLHGPATAATNATASARIDTYGFRSCVIEATLGPKATATNSSAKWAALKLSEADNTTYVSTGIYAFTGTTNTVTDATNGLVIAPHNDTSIAQVSRLFVDLRGRKRYLFVTYQAADSHSTVAIQARLSKADEMPNTSTEMCNGAIAIG